MTGFSSTGTTARRRARVGVAVLALVVGACADTGISHEVGTDPRLRFEGSAASLRSLGDQVLAALVAGDVDALEGLRLTEHEHNEVVWPELPASAPEVGFPLDYAWQNIQARNARGLARILPIYGERELAYRRVECRGETERFETFEVMTDCWVVFHADGATWEGQAFKDVLARGGGYKIFRYYDEEPRRFEGASDG